MNNTQTTKQTKKRGRGRPCFGQNEEERATIQRILHIYRQAEKEGNRLNSYDIAMALIAENVPTCLGGPWRPRSVELILARNLSPIEIEGMAKKKRKRNDITRRLSISIPVGTFKKIHEKCLSLDKKVEDIVARLVKEWANNKRK